MLKFRNLSILFLCSCLLFMGTANNRSVLEDKVQKFQKDIELANKLLAETADNKKKTATNVMLIEQKIRLRNSVVEEINIEIQLLNQTIERNKQAIDLMNQEIVLIKEEYANMIRYAHKNRDSYTVLMYLLASENFNQAYKRLIYFQQYSQYRKHQIELLLSKQDELSAMITSAQVTINKKNRLLNQEKQETETLSSEKDSQAKLIAELGKKEKEIMSEISVKRKQADKLRKEIEEIIALEVKRKAEEERLKQKPTDGVINKNFADNKGRLIWPIEKGVITSKFGEHPHPVLTNIMIVNNGIDISTSKNANVRVIFDGVVSKIIMIPGGNAAIIVRHGDFLSVYSNVVNVKVKSGQKVTAKQVIGTVFTDDETGQSILQLQIWKETNKLNPELWLAKM